MVIFEGGEMEMELEMPRLVIVDGWTGEAGPVDGPHANVGGSGDGWRDDAGCLWY